MRRKKKRMTASPDPKPGIRAQSIKERCVPKPLTNFVSIFTSCHSVNYFRTFPSLPDFLLHPRIPPVVCQFFFPFFHFLSFSEPFFVYFLSQKKKVSWRTEAHRHLLFVALVKNLSEISFCARASRFLVFVVWMTTSPHNCLQTFSWKLVSLSHNAQRSLTRLFREQVLFSSTLLPGLARRTRLSFPFSVEESFKKEEENKRAQVFFAINWLFLLN